MLFTKFLNSVYQPACLEPIITFLITCPFKEAPNYLVSLNVWTMIILQTLVTQASLLSFHKKGREPLQFPHKKAKFHWIDISTVALRKVDGKFILLFSWIKSISLSPPSNLKLAQFKLTDWIECKVVQGERGMKSEETCWQAKRWNCH